MTKNKSKIISRLRAGLASLCLVSSTLTVPYANASILLDSKVISPVTTDMDMQGSYGIDSEGRLVFCDPEQDGCTYHQGDNIKQLLSSDDIQSDNHWRYLLTQNGDVWKALWGDTGVESTTKIATNIKQMRWAGGDSNLIYFRTKDDTMSAYHLRTDTYHYHPEQYPLLSKILDFDVSSPLGVALNDAGDVVLWNVNAIAGGISYMFQTVKPPEGKTLVNVAVGGVPKAGSTSIYALDQEGYLYKFNYEFTGSSFETGPWTPVASGVRFTDIESGNGLSQSGRIWSLSLLPGEVDSRYYRGKGDEHPWYSPRVFTEIWGEGGTSSYMEAAGRYWATSGYNKRDSCLSLSEEVYFSHEDCIFTPYDGIHTENPGVVYTHPSVIVPNKPSVREKCGELPTVIVPPDTNKVRYERTQEGNKVTVNAYPKAGYVMTSQSSWSYTLTPSASCPVVSATASPTPVPTVTPTVEVPAPLVTTSTKPSVFPMTTVTAPPSPTTSLPPIPLHTGTFTTSKPSSTKPAVPVETVVASASTPVVTKPVLESTPIAEPTPTSEPAGFQFKPWYLLAGLAPLVALPALLPKPVSNVAPVTTPTATPSATVSSLSPTTSVSPTTVSQSKAKGIVSGVTAYENRGWLVLVGVLLIAVCSALFVSRRQEGKK